MVGIWSTRWCIALNKSMPDCQQTDGVMFCSGDWECGPVGSDFCQYPHPGPMDCTSRSLTNNILCEEFYKPTITATGEQNRCNLKCQWVGPKKRNILRSALLWGAGIAGIVILVLLFTHHKSSTRGAAPLVTNRPYSSRVANGDLPQMPQVAGGGEDYQYDASTSSRQA